MKSIEGIEKNILEKYLEGHFVEEEDRSYLERMASVGFIRIGFDFETKRETAKTTNCGYSCII